MLAKVCNAILQCLGSAAMDPDSFVSDLPIERRLALAYAPARTRELWLGLFVFDQRLGAVVAGQREPVLAQIKLAWWREELAKLAPLRARGEPVLALLDAWGDHAAGLAPLVDSWEMLLGDTALTAAVAEQIAAQRGAALADLAALTGTSELAAPHDWRAIKLPRDLRPLAVLYGLARHSRGQGALLAGPRAGLRAVRLGMLGI